MPSKNDFLKKYFYSTFYCICVYNIKFRGTILQNHHLQSLHKVFDQFTCKKKLAVEFIPFFFMKNFTSNNGTIHLIAYEDIFQRCN